MKDTVKGTIDDCKYYDFVECITAQLSASPTTVKSTFSPSDAPAQCFSPYEEKHEAFDNGVGCPLKKKNTLDVDKQIERVQAT